MSATSQTGAVGNVVPLRMRPSADDGERDLRLGWLAPFFAGVVALSALDGGLYEPTHWGLLAALTLAMAAGLLMAGQVGSFGRLTPALLALVGLTAWTATSILWADSPGRAWTESNRLAFYTAVVAICVVTMRTRVDVRRSLAVIGTVVAAAALWTTVVLLRGEPGAFVDHRLDAPIGYINGTAGLFLMGLWPLVSFAERGRHPLLAGGAVALAVVEANLLVLTQSRAIIPALLLSTCVLLALYPGRAARIWTLLLIGAGAAAASPWTLAIYADRMPLQPTAVAAPLARSAALAALISALVAGVIWVGITVLRRRLTSPHAPRVAAGGAVATVVCVLALALIASGDPLSRAQHEWRAFTTLDVTETSSTRFTGAGGFRYDLWRVAIDDWQREPLRGVGAGSYGLSYYQQRRQDESIRQPHSLPLQILAELGLVGALLALVAFAATVAVIVRNRRADVFAGIAGTGIAVSWGVQASLDWLYNLPGLTCVAIVGAVAASGATPFLAFTGPRRRRAIFIGAALLVAIGAASLGRYYSAEVYAQRARDALPERPGVALARSATAASLNPYSVETMYVEAAAYARLDDYSRARDALMRAADREPLNFVPWALLGDLATRRRDLAQARAAYHRASVLNPRDFELRTLANDALRALP